MVDEEWNLNDEDAYMGVCVVCRSSRPIKMYPDDDLHPAPICKQCWDDVGRKRTALAVWKKITNKANFLALLGCAVDAVWLVRSKQRFMSRCSTVDGL